MLVLIFPGEKSGHSRKSSRPAKDATCADVWWDPCCTSSHTKHTHFTQMSNETRTVPASKHKPHTLCRRLTRLSLYSWLPSIMPVRGFENHSLKSRCDWKTLGIRKCIKDHNSIRLFWSGVPVSRRRRWLVKLSSICHRCDLKFLMFWACSKNVLKLSRFKIYSVLFLLHPKSWKYHCKTRWNNSEIQCFFVFCLFYQKGQ